MAHSFVQSYAVELEAFRRYAAVHGSETVLLLDTYDTLRSGLPNAITVAREMIERGQSLAGVRLDSGDLAYLARRVRAALDAAGLPDVKIVASNQLDELLIRSLLLQGAPIDIFGVGTALATGSPDAALDGVYKLAEVAGRPCMKVSNNLAKSTLPGRKQVTRFHDPERRFMADAIHVADEDDIGRMIHPFDPCHRRHLTDWTGEPLLAPVMRNGRPVHPPVSLDELSARGRERLDRLPEEHRRLENPHVYKVGLSERLCVLRDGLLEPTEKENAR
jgi:nicotinate phosphoribosyltransferase